MRTTTPNPATGAIAVVWDSDGCGFLTGTAPDSVEPNALTRLRAVLESADPAFAIVTPE
jgi:hypothetical protein